MILGETGGWRTPSQISLLWFIETFIHSFISSDPSGYCKQFGMEIIYISCTKYILIKRLGHKHDGEYILKVQSVWIISSVWLCLLRDLMDSTYFWNMSSVWVQQSQCVTYIYISLSNVLVEVTLTLKCFFFFFFKWDYYFNCWLICRLFSWFTDWLFGL